MQLLFSRKTFLPTIFFSFLLSLTSFAQSDIDKGIELFQQGELVQAKTFFNTFLKSDKKNSEANFYLGRIYFDEENYGKAIDWFKKAAKHDRSSSKYPMWLGHSYGRRAQNAGKLKQAFYAKDSRKNYEKAIELDPNNVEARESAMEFYLQAPGFMGGGRDKAEKQATLISNIDEVAGFTAWGRIYSYYDEPISTLENYTKALEAYPEEMVFYYRLYNYHFGEQEYSEASDIAKKQLSYNDTTAVIYLNLGNAQQRNDEFEEAYLSYQKALDLDSDLYGVWYQIGRLAAVSDMYLNEGEESLIQFIAKKDEYNSNTLAWAYYRLGTIYEKKESIEAAKDQYQQALKANKDHSESKEALSRLN
ncbi:MAG: tetratricopeptide repeat protein [Balneolaceae bacterium]